MKFQQLLDAVSSFYWIFEGYLLTIQKHPFLLAHVSLHMNTLKWDLVLTT